MDSSLENFIHTVSGDQYFRVEDDLGNGFVRLKAAEAQRRQAQQDIRSTEDIVIELLRNSRDAHARAIFLATWTEGTRRYITVLDDGDGIPSSMHEVVFEPFVTSKLDSFHSDKWGVHGRGMALYSIKQNAESARIVASDTGIGSVFHVTTDLNNLSEKRDQSTFPQISKDQNGKPILRGPHNIIRTTMEFAIEERSRISVYLGSSASIVATLYSLGSQAAGLLNILDSWDDSTPIINRFAYVDDADSLADLANGFCLPISTRTAHRIIKGEIEPLPLHLTSLVKPRRPSKEQPTKQHGSGYQEKSSPRVRIAIEDLLTFNQSVKNAFTRLSAAYYLESDVDIESRIKGDELIVKIPLRKLDL